MADLLRQDTGLVLWITACAILIVLHVQLALCFRYKGLLVKCLPVAIFSVSTVLFYGMAITTRTWVAFLYLIMAVFSGVFLASCGMAWRVWGIHRLTKIVNRCDDA